MQYQENQTGNSFQLRFNNFAIAPPQQHLHSLAKLFYEKRRE
jgi:hypothetical protein